MNFDLRFLFRAAVVCLLSFSFLTVSARMRGNSYGVPQSAQNGFVAPSDVNAVLGSDVRLFAVMIALNLAGYDYEPSGKPMGELRARLRNELQPDPSLVSRLESFYRSKRRVGADEPSQAAPYVALAFMMSQPPELALAVPPKLLPPDVAAVADFAALAGELYRRTKLEALLPKYGPEVDKISKTYIKPLGEMIFQVVSYLHTRPVTFIGAPPPTVTVTKDKKGNVVSQPPIRRGKDRYRRMFVILDPLSPSDTAFVRNDIVNMLGLKDPFDIRLGDDYIVVVGPTARPNMDEIRRTFIRFVVDPIIEKYTNDLFDAQSRKPTGLSENILKLTAKASAIDPQLKDNVTLIVRESMVYAAEAGMARLANKSPQQRAAVEEDNLYNLSRQYERGAVLAFHFYEKFKGLEDSGVDLRDLYTTFIRAVNFDTETARVDTFAALKTKVEARRAADRTHETLSLPGVDEGTNKSLDQADVFIRGRQFPQASAILKGILNDQPKNARALFGIAQITSQQPSAKETDPKSDEDDRTNAQEERLGQALILYRSAIEAASPEYEVWIKSRAYVAIGRIFDFVDKREAAIAEYEEAIKLKDVKNGAYQEALEGKDHPLLPKSSGKP